MICGAPLIQTLAIKISSPNAPQLVQSLFPNRDPFLCDFVTCHGAEAFAFRSSDFQILPERYDMTLAQCRYLTYLAGVQSKLVSRNRDL